MSKLQAYKELLAVAEKYEEVLSTDSTFSSNYLIEEVQRCELEERFGLKLHPGNELYGYQVHNAYDNWTRLNYYDGIAKGISWPDGGKQPDAEWLFVICFTSGAYIFGDSYPKTTFNAFFDELKSYSPKYSDTMNNCLYFTEENSKAVYEAFWDIFKKYQALVKDEVKLQRKKALEEELAKLNEEIPKIV